ncbi:hypothetical protein NPX13_g2672 [Xylaria arbuscula]|uniref:STAS domain-containing protein n=1 Tax=Xylaria arbuscula TaxID=114810 RepID=A0A9W8NJR9_9PEZI|nr:hypothetical protein NPX13_g2672 [Xylaria arbuscula]
MSAPLPPPDGSQPPSQPHLPSTPSGLRKSTAADDDGHGHDVETACRSPSRQSGLPSAGANRPYHDDATQTDNDNHDTVFRPLSRPEYPPHGASSVPESDSMLHDETTSLLHSERAYDSPRGHGTFSPRALSPPLRHAQAESEGTTLLGSDAPDTPQNLFKRAAAWILQNLKITTAMALAEQHGVKMSWYAVVSYYIPCLTWLRQYRPSWLLGDLTAAITMTSMYLPMALSYAENLAHVAPISGLYAFVFQPFIYAILGSCPQMVVGPEAAGSLLVGSIVKANIDGGQGQEDDAVVHAKIAGVAVGVAGASVFMMGIARTGFIDNVLSRPFLRGFISSIGVVIFIDQLTPVLGLNKVAASVPNVPHHTTVDKFLFIITHLTQWHRLSGIIGIVSFVVIMVLREVKRRLQSRYPKVAYFPDRLFVVVLSALLAYKLGWESQGVEILGKVEAPSGRIFTFRNPFQWSHLPHILEALGTSFLIGMLGFFESSVAAKSLGEPDHIEGMQLSPNRELIALGVANIAGSCFMALPAFGGYGRSKVNKSTGGRTPISSVLISIITIICIRYLLSWFYYIPKPVLSAMIMVVAWSLIEEIPEDLSFFARIKGWKELLLMATIVTVTVFFSLNLGIAIGIGWSLLEVLRHATKSRIQILGRDPTTGKFKDVDGGHAEEIKKIEGCLIVKIPEPLTFANTGELKGRLRRVEKHGTNMGHPALPRLRPQASNRNVIFDIHGVTSLDGSGAQVLEEIVRKNREQGIRVFFSRAPSRTHNVWKLLERSGIVKLVGQEHFVSSIDDALRMAELLPGPAPEGAGGGREADHGAISAA